MAAPIPQRTRARMCSRSRTAEFHAARSTAKRARCRSDQVSLDDHLRRLKLGFAGQYCSGNAIWRLLTSRGGDSWTLSPEQLARVQLDAALGCALCFAAPPRLPFLTLRRPPAGCCRVCGLRVCDACSSQDLLLFYPDDCADAAAAAAVATVGGAADELDAVRWCLIGESGCPQAEPRRSRQLRVCSRCRAALGEAVTKTEAAAADPSAKLLELYKGHCRISADLTARWSAVTDLSAPLLKPNPNGSGGGDLSSASQRRLAKSYTDLCALLDEYYIYLEGFRGAEDLLVGGCVRRCHGHMRAALSAFYADWRTRVRELRSQLGAVLPVEALGEITRLADGDALNAAFTQATQLTYEMLQWQSRQVSGSDPASGRLASELVSLCQRIEAEIESRSADWQTGSRPPIQELVKERMLSRPLLRHTASTTVGELRHQLTRRLIFLAEQLEGRCSDGAAPLSRTALRATLDWLLTDGYSAASA